jgi:hypothetical protein
MGLSGTWLQLRHVLTARGRHSIHSPFVFDWYNKVCLGREGTWLQRMEEYFDTTAKPFSTDQPSKMMVAEMETFSGEMPEACEVLILYGMHQSSKNHQKWKELEASTTAEVRITLRNRGLLICRPGQVRQGFLLR